MKKHLRAGLLMAALAGLTAVSMPIIVGGVAGSSTAAAAAATTTTATTQAATTTETGPHKVIVEMFEWSWNSIASECTNVLGPDGYGAVQTSPPEAHYVDAADGYPWWEQYQPVDYSLTSRLGDQAEYQNMINACHAAGVKVYADVLINNMSGFNGGPTSDGSTFTQYDYPAVPYTSSDFHSCETTITDWDDENEVFNCEESGLADLDTELPYVQQTLANYMNSLISLGVDGFRFDSAKSVPDADIVDIENLLTKPVFIFQDVPYGAGQPVTPQMYTSTGAVADGQYQDAIGEIFQDGDLASLDQFGTESTWLPSADVVVYTDDHDSQRDGDTNILTFANGQIHTLANVFMLAYPYGIPKIMSSYYFNGNYNQGPPMDSEGNALPATCTATTYVCEQRIPAIVGMVGFNNAVGTTTLNNWWTNGSDQIAFGRGDVGFVAINTSGSSLTNTWQTDLPAGQYCDVIHGSLVDGACTGPTLTVNGSGQLTATVASMDAVAIDTSSTPATTSSTTTTAGSGTTTTTSSSGVTETVDVTVPADTAATGDTVYLAGNLSVLGEGQSDWAANGVAMTEVNGTLWTATVHAASATTLSYKYDLGGNWDNNEETASCAYVSNRSMSVNGGAENDVVANWEGVGSCGGSSPTTTTAASTTTVAPTTTTAATTTTVAPTTTTVAPTTTTVAPTTTTTAATTTTTAAPTTTTTSSSGVTETVNVTVPVNTAASGDTVYLAGNLSVLGEGQSDWAANGVAMTELNDTHWTATIHAASDATLSYKYDLGGNWDNSEETASCGSVANRSMSVNGGTENDIVANWEGPNTCGSAQAVIDVTVPSSTPSGDTVYIAGNFSALGTGMSSSNDWTPNLYPMNKIGTDEWQILVPAVSGNTLDYKFDLNGTWSNGEETSSCGSVANRTFEFNGSGSSYTASDTVGAWEGLNGC